MAHIWQQHLDSLAAAGGSNGSSSGSFSTDIATQTQRLTLDIVGLTAFSHDFKQVQVRLVSLMECPLTNQPTGIMLGQYEAS